MSILLNGDCLDEMKTIDDKSVDLIFCDLPYGQTSCKWDCLIDLDKLWIEFMRIKKLNTPIIMTCTTKFGVSLINSCPKKCPFRYDLIWCKSAPAGFLCAKKMPMRKHEMIYVFYEKLPFYDLSSHKHKFIKQYQDEDMEKSLYGNMPKTGKDKESHSAQYEPALPTSLIKEEENIIDGPTYNTKNRKKPITREPPNKYDPPLPTSLIKENGPEPEPENDNIKRPDYKTESDIYGDIKREDFIRKNGESMYDPALPTSLIKDVYNANERFNNGKLTKNDRKLQKGDDPIYEPPLPNSLLEIKSTRGKHSTEKPVALMSWILKYYSKECDIILDPTMGSGSMGIACKEMNRDFIGIEKDEEIYEFAVNRIEE